MTDAESDKKRGQPPPQLDAFSAQADPIESALQNLDLGTGEAAVPAGKSRIGRSPPKTHDGEITLNLLLPEGIGNEQSLYPKVAEDQVMEAIAPPPGPALPQPKRNDFLFGFSDKTSDRLKAVFQGSDLLPGSEPANRYGPGELPDFLRATSTGIKALIQTSEKIKALFQRSEMLNPSNPNAYRVPNRNKFLFGFSNETSDRIKAVFRGSDLLPNSDPDARPPETGMQALFQTGTRIKQLFQRTRPPLHQSVPEEELDSIFDGNNPGSESLTSYACAQEGSAESFVWTANPQESEKVIQEKILRDLVVSKAIPRSARKETSKPKSNRIQTIIALVTPVMILLVVFLVWQVGHSWVAQQFVNGGIQQLSKGDTSAALTSFDRAIQLDAQNASAYFNRGDAYRQKGDLKKASDDYHTSLTLVRGR